MEDKQAFIDACFRSAREADPGVRLVYNDYGIELHGRRHRKTAGTFSKLAEIGLDGIVTELHLRLPTDGDDAEGAVTGVQLAAQGEQYRRIVATALAQPNCSGVLTWGFTDERSWVPRFFPGMGHALPFDRDYRKKPAYQGMRKAFEEAPSRNAPGDSIR